MKLETLFKVAENSLKKFLKSISPMPVKFTKVYILKQMSMVLTSHGKTFKRACSYNRITL